jgi:hypothetical protein
MGWLWLFAALGQPALAQADVYEQAQIVPVYFVSIGLPGINGVHGIDSAHLLEAQCAELRKYSSEGGAEKGGSHSPSVSGVASKSPKSRKDPADSHHNGWDLLGFIPSLWLCYSSLRRRRE